MIKVALNGAEFFAYHGFYPEEQILGTRYFVDIEVFFDNDNLQGDNINNTVNYEMLYAIAKKEMANPRKLIETVANAVIDKIVAKFPFIMNVSVTIKKMHPTLGGPVKNSAVSISYRQD